MTIICFLSYVHEISLSLRQLKRYNTSLVFEDLVDAICINKIFENATLLWTLIYKTAQSP